MTPYIEKDEYVLERKNHLMFAALRNALETVDKFAIPCCDPDTYDKWKSVNNYLWSVYLPITSDHFMLGSEYPLGDARENETGKDSQYTTQEEWEKMRSPDDQLQEPV